ncbi:MAG: hypothetical protein HY867_08980 [Chloroflexi bacterium]|nr:hypothetical protein [Chloroflexota bacterium]
MDSNRSNPELVVLPFQARLTGDVKFLNLEQVLVLRAHPKTLRIERSYPGAPHAIGWTIFRRAPQTYLYEGEQLFRFERGARNRLRQKYAIHYSLVGETDALTFSHQNL